MFAFISEIVALYHMDTIVVVKFMYAKGYMLILVSQRCGHCLRIGSSERIPMQVIFLENENCEGNKGGQGKKLSKDVISHEI